ncbi:hypothetical protein QSV08_02210 [Maribacter sp. BPC-D8]|uniref:hypothetical protein n=1 Tax=Maribacter sp. BPC-D8 TaxID=3053613 RepID=UPI002B495539|nr:hypothetical protein [Maribacter sp. BPC-D8]WRI30055.1 hypothetical protein QSV08_02210 [Maribacter sp. BPC-D8]
MLKFHQLLFFVLSFCFNFSQAQDEKQISLEDNFSIEDFGFTDKGNFYTLELVKKMDYESRYRVWGENFELLGTVTTEDDIKKYEFQYPSDNGRSFAYNDRLDLAIGSSSSIKFDKGEFESINLYHQFLTDNKFIGIGKKIEGKELKFSWNNVIENKEILSFSYFMFVKDLESGSIKVYPISKPEDCELKDNNTQVLYYDDDNIIMSFIKETSTIERSYIVATYSTTGRKLNERELKFSVDNPENEKFAIVNLENGGFDQTTTSDNSGFGNSLSKTDVDTHTFANDKSQGDIRYDALEKTYYIYAGIKPKKGDSGILIQKFDEKGELIWRKNHIFSETSFHYINSFNRFLTFDVYQPFIGVSVYSTKGKNYCDFYVIDKNSGELKASKKYKNYNFFRKSKKYNGLGAEYKINSDGLKNLGIDRSIIYSSLYNDKFNNYIQALNAEGRFLIIGEYTDDGFNLVVSPESGNQFRFKKFIMN